MVMVYGLIIWILERPYSFSEFSLYGSVTSAFFAPLGLEGCNFILYGLRMDYFVNFLIWIFI